MIKAKDLKRLISMIPDDANCIAYEGEGCGLRILYEGRFGWIETGWGDDKECDHGKHEIDSIKKRGGNE